MHEQLQIQVWSRDAVWFRRTRRKRGLSGCALFARMRRAFELAAAKDRDNDQAARTGVGEHVGNENDPACGPDKAPNAGRRSAESATVPATA